MGQDADLAPGSIRLRKESCMALESRIRELDLRHRDLDSAIQSEASHPSSDAVRITELKRQKLKIKEELERLRSRN